MTTFYVDYINGSDSNNGLGPDASAVTNKPWKTITKLLGAAGMASGDTAYLSPAGPFREVVSVAMTSATVETKIIGDPQNLQGFKDSSGALVSPGPIIWTAYTTNDKTVPSSTSTLTLAGRDFLTFQKIMFVGGGGSATEVDATTNTSVNITFQDCTFLGNSTSNGLSVTSTFNVTMNWVVDRCLFLQTKPSGTAINFAPASGSGSDYDVAFAVKNCIILGFNNGVSFVPSGAGAQKPGGMTVRNCFVMVPSVGLRANSTGASTSIPCVFNNNVVIGAAQALFATTSGQVTEDYNIIAGTTVRTNVTAGAHSISDDSRALLFHFGQELQWGMQLRRFGEPVIGSPLLDFGNDGTQSAYDLFNNPRPATAALAAAGAMERANTWVRELGVLHTGQNALRCDGPGYQDFLIPVDAVSTTISFYMRFDSTYAGTKPQIQVLNGEECGVTAATSSAVTTVDTWEQLSLNFTPTKKGIVTVRLLSSDTNGAGKAYADSFAVA